MDGRKGVVIAAGASGAGKTTLACSVIRLLSASGLDTGAFKLARGGDAPAGVVEGAGRSGSDTWRFVEAGARRSALVRYSSVRDLPSLLSSLDARCEVCIWESNAAAGLLPHDVLVYIATGGGGKNPELAAVADILMEERPGPAEVEAAARRVCGMLGVPLPGEPTEG